MRDATFIAEVDEKMIQKEDGGQSLSIELSSEQSNLFVRILSWDEYKTHQDFHRLIGRRIKVTIEDAVDDL